jgi:hypothetical protein
MHALLQEGDIYVLYMHAYICIYNTWVYVAFTSARMYELLEEADTLVFGACATVSQHHNMQVDLAQLQVSASLRTYETHALKGPVGLLHLRPLRTPLRPCRCTLTSCDFDQII